jgi:hypothetical protein
VKNFIGTSTTEFFLPNFSGVNDTAEINVTPLETQTDFTSPFSSFKGKIQQKYFNGKYPHTIQVLKAEISWGLHRPHFGDFRSDYLGQYDAMCKTALAC